MIPRDPELRKLLHRNWLGKLGAEGWRDFLGTRWRALLCRTLGHRRPVQRFTARVCPRCLRVLGP